MKSSAQFIALIALCGAFASPGIAQQASLLGSVRDSISREPLEGVQIELLARGTAVAAAVTGRDGTFTLTELAPGLYTLVARRVDYRAHRVDDLEIAVGESLVIVITLKPHAITINPIVVSASRTEQKALDAPASVSVVDAQQIADRTALTAIDHVHGVPAVDIATTGLTQHEVVVRGFSNVASGALLALADNRYISVPSLRINVYNFIPTANEDVERIEVVRGPGSALYGPNSANGVLHIISRSPFDSPGAVVTLAGGERSLFQGSIRHASTFGRRFGLKVSAQYLRGSDWQLDDPDEQSNRLVAIAQGADEDTLLIGRRDPTVERLAGEARLDWRLTPQTSLVTSVGANLAARNVELTPLGAAQVRDWRYTYLQSRLRHGRLFAQAFLNLSDAGDTYLLRSGNTVTDNSFMAVAQLQHGTLLGTRADLIYGLDLQRTVPRTDSTITGRNEDDDAINEAGAYVHGEVTISSALQLVAATRVDYHNRLDDLVFSPRAALVYRAAPSHTLRLTYNRAFSTPTTNNLFLDLFGDSVRAPTGEALPYAVRLVGVPRSGFTFRRDCGGLCMRSPFTPDDLGGPGTWLPVDATLVWPAVVQLLAARGIDIAPIPQPTAADVATNLALISISGGSPEPVSDVANLPVLRPTITNAVELGYRAAIGDRVTLAVDLYRTWKNDFVSAEQVETPNAFFDPVTLADYLSRYMPRDTALFLAGLIASAPMGTVTPEQARDPWDILITYRNFGKITQWGADLDVAAFLTPSIALRGTYSWTNRNTFEVVNASGKVDTIPLNAPANRGSLAGIYRDERLGLNAEVRVRAVEGFPVRSGVYEGDVESYAVMDAAAGYRLPFNRRLTVTLSAQNLVTAVRRTEDTVSRWKFRAHHQEFIGAPMIGRLVTVRVRAEF